MEWKLFKKENEGRWFCVCPKCAEKGECGETVIEIRKHHKWKGIPKYKRGHYTSIYTQTKDIKREHSNGWKGGRYTDKDGYALVYMPEHPSARKSGYILEHRLIMEQRMGRLLTEKEVVHHRGRKSDNKNTELFPSNGDHLKVELSALRDKGELYKQKDFLTKEYIEKNRSLADIGRQFGVSLSAVFHFVGKFGIKKIKADVDAARTDYIRKGYNNKYLREEASHA